MKVEVFIPCFVDQFNPETGFNMIKVLEKAGCKVHYNPEQTCCGLPAMNAGRQEDAREVGEKLLNEISSDKQFICGAASCTGMIRNSYDLLFQNSSYHNKYRMLQKRTFELSEFLVDVLKIESLGSTYNKKVYYLHACNAVNNCSIQEQPIKLLKQVEGLELTNTDINDCCGFGGMFSLKNDELAVHMGKKLIEEILLTGAEVVVSSDYSCLVHLQSIVLKNNINLKFSHIADVLASGI